MNIKGIDNQYHLSKEIKKTKSAKSEKGTVKDKIEISPEAKALSSSEKSKATKLKAIEEKIEAKYYDSDSVISKVADKILKDIKSG